MQRLPGIPADMPQRAGDASDPVTVSNYYYCLEEFHPGVLPYSQQPLDAGRIFGVDDDRGCPVCPGCQRQVSAVPCVGPQIPPQSIVEYSRRFAASQITGGGR